jgi:hypothetical protein
LLGSDYGVIMLSCISKVSDDGFVTGCAKEARGAEYLILFCTLKKETESVYKSEMIDSAQNISQIM